MTPTIRAARPVLLSVALLGAIILMCMGLIKNGDANVIPLWYQGLLIIGFGWFFKDRTKERQEVMEIKEKKVKNVEPA